MDTKETLARFPLTGSLLAIILGIVFVLCRTHDQAIQAPLYAYHAEHLLSIEAPLYEDFYSKRLAIEQLGSSDRLAQFRSAQQDRLKPLLSQMILSDRSFRPYLNEKSHLFFSARELENWRSHSVHLEQLIAGLSRYQLALIPEEFKASPEFSRLFSYLFIETDLLNLLSNVLCLLILFILLEPHVIRRAVWASLFGLCLAHGGLYLVFAGPLTAPLSGANVLVYFMFSLAICRSIYGHIQTRTTQQLYLTLLISVICLLKIGLDIYFQFIFPAQSAGIILAAVMGGLLACRGAIWRMKPLEPENRALPEVKHSDLPMEFRVPYQEALTALTRFNFAYARSALAHLHTQVPASVQLLESRYHLEKLHPDEGQFWPLLKARLEQAAQQRDYHLLLWLFNDMQKYRETGHTIPELVGPSVYLEIQHIFLQHHNLEKAELAFKLLQVHADSATLKEACQLLIEHFANKKLLAKQAHYQTLYDNL